MKLLFILAGNETKASSRVRGYWVAKELNKLGHVSILLPHRGISTILRAFILILFSDVIIFQKTYSKYHLILLKLTKTLSKKCYVDIDDAPSRTMSEITLKYFREMSAQANGVFAGSQELVKLASQFQSNTFLIPSSLLVEAYRSSINRTNEGVVELVWVGNGNYYADDLINILVPPLKKLAAKQKLRFKIIGAMNNFDLQTSFNGIEGLDIIWVHELDWSNPSKLAQELATSDIGLYPLIENDFNKYKCGFKALEYMVMKLPVVSSDIAFNAQIVLNNKTGLIATTEDQWLESLNSLIEDKLKRTTMGEAGYSHLQASYSTTVIANTIHHIISKTNDTKIST